MKCSKCGDKLKRPDYICWTCDARVRRQLLLLPQRRRANA